MAYRVKSEGNNVFTVEPKGFWSSVSYRDLICALSELSPNTHRIVSVTRCFDWGTVRYLVVVEER